MAEEKESREIMLESCITTFKVDEIFDISVSLFRNVLEKYGKEIESSRTKPILFIFYEDYISDPIDKLKNNEDKDRVDFYEVISLMSWSLFRVWVRKVVDEKGQLDCMDGIPKNKVINLFLENIDCEEGSSLLSRVGYAPGQFNARGLSKPIADQS